MNEDFIYGQEDLDYYNYHEDIQEFDYIDEDVLEENYLNEDYLNEDYEDDYYTDDDGDYSESFGRFKGLRSRRPGRFGRPKKRRYPQMVVARGPKNYFKPRINNRPVNTKNVAKAFGAASKDISRTKAAVQSLDVKNKVQDLKIKDALDSQSKRILGTEYAQAATIVVEKLREENEDLKNNKFINMALPLLPVLLQKPPKMDFIKDPRVLSIVATAGIAIFKELQKDKAGS